MYRSLLILWTGPLGLGWFLLLREDKLPRWLMKAKSLIGFVLELRRKVGVVEAAYAATLSARAVTISVSSSYVLYRGSLGTMPTGFTGV